MTAYKVSALDFSNRAAKLTKLIENTLGASSATAHRFDVPLLEKQALRFLRLEDELAKSKNELPTHHCAYFQTIVAACCYIQTKQAQKWQIPMKDFTKICKLLKIKRCSRAIDFVEKWQEETKKSDSENESPNSPEIT